MKNIFVIFLTLILAGCVGDGNSPNVATPPQIQVVKIPVVRQIPSPPVINKPDLAINHLPANATQEQKIKAEELTTVQLVTYSNKLKSALEVYRTNKLNLKRKHSNKVS